jgi:hypothetical protein
MNILLQLAGLLVFAIAFITASHAAAPGSADMPEPIIVGPVPLLFSDDTGVAFRKGVVRTVHVARTSASPVIQADQPWEGNRVYTYGSVLQDAETGEFRLWYGSRPETERAGRSDGAQGRAPQLRNNGFDVTLYATSRDGLAWEKPKLNLIEFAGSAGNNIIFDLHSPAVIFDRFEKDAQRRYKMLGYLVRPGNGYHAAYSADGVRWHSYSPSLVLEHGDTITLTQNPVTGEYLACHKRPAQVRGFGRRVVWLSRSRDFQKWSEPEMVFTADEVDDAWVSRPNERTEVYNMSVYAHAGGYIGLPAIFRVMQLRERTEVGPGQSPVDGPIDIQLATSPDGRRWKRSWPRLNVIPRGAPGAFDGGTILGVSSTSIDVADETWAYYTAINTGHGGPMPPKRITIGRAVWRRHGFVSLDAGPEGGRVETQPLRFRGGALLINADAPRGNVRVGLVEADGKPINGRALEDCEPLNADATRWRVRWQGSGAVPTDRPVRVVFELQNARLYSVASLDERSPEETGKPTLAPLR